MSVFRHFWSTGGIQEADGSHSDRQREQTAEKEVRYRDRPMAMAPMQHLVLV